MSHNKVKKVLYITEHNPFTNSYGAEQRANVFLKAALANDCYVDIAFIDAAEDITPSITNERINIVFWGYNTTFKTSLYHKFLRYYGLESLIHDRSLKIQIEKIINSNSYDYIICRYLHCAQKSGLWKYRNKLILDIDDLPVESTIYKLENDSKHKIINQLLKVPLTYLLRHITKRWIRNSYATYLPSEEMAKKWYTRLLPNIPIIHVDNPKYVKSNNILFIGILSYRPNYKAMDHFVDNVLPLIVTKYKDVHLMVAGKGLPKDISDKWKGNPNITELGFVENIYDFYNIGNIVICPIEEGGGTNIKVIEAMAMSKACVLSRFCVKGFENVIENGVNAYIAKNDCDFAEQISTLLENENLCNEMMTKAHEKARESYSQYTINNIISSALR